LTVQDVKDLWMAKQQLDGVVNALRTTNWAGAGASINSLAFIDVFIASLYNRAEPHWLRYLQRGKSQPDQDAAPEPADGAMPELAPSANRTEPGK
jgi:hypothetical protein